jgi:leader peptidase (prepilin peptidase)/N-methyltransferase
LAAWKFGFTGLLVAALVFSWSLLVLFFIDLQHQILPDEITLSILWLGLLFNIYGFFTTLQNAVVGAMVGYVTLWLIGWLFKKIRGIEGIGYGDYKLFALCGAWLGWQSLPLILVIASSAGLVYGVVLLLRKKIQRQTPFAFGTFLALAAWIIMFFGNYFIR